MQSNFFIDIVNKRVYIYRHKQRHGVTAIIKEIKTMKKSTNTKKINEAFKQHVLDCYDINDLKANMDAVGGVNEYRKGAGLVEGGSFLVYYYEVKDFLMEVLEQTEDEANKYSDEKSWELYKHKVAQACERLYKGK